MLRAAVRILPVTIMADSDGCCSCCGWFCGLCCCCCRRYRAKRETSPLLSTTGFSGGGGGGRRESEEMSRVRVTASPDGQSETQTVEVKVRTRDDEKDETNGSLEKVKRRSREVAPRDPGTSTTFVRGSSGRSSWRMVPNSSKRQSTASVTEKTEDVKQETEVGEVKVELVSTAAVETPPPPPKAYRLTQTFEEDEDVLMQQGTEEEEEEEEEEQGMIVHTSSFSFAARDGKLIDTR